MSRRTRPIPPRSLRPLVRVPPVLQEKDVYGRENKQQNYYDEGNTYSNINLSLLGGRKKIPQKLRD